MANESELQDSDRLPEITPEEVEADLKQWIIARAINTPKHKAAVFRIRTSRPSYQDTSDFHTAVTIGWRYDSPTGFPEGEDKERILAFERATDNLTWRNGYSELVQVGTGIGLKEWLFYTRDRERFMDELNRSLASLPAFPLSIEFYDDPEWKIWSTTLAELQGPHA